MHAPPDRAGAMGTRRVNTPLGGLRGGSARAVNPDPPVIPHGMAHPGSLTPWPRSDILRVHSCSVRKINYLYRHPDPPPAFPVTGALRQPGVDGLESFPSTTAGRLSVHRGSVFRTGRAGQGRAGQDCVRAREPVRRALRLSADVPRSALREERPGGAEGESRHGEVVRTGGATFEPRRKCGPRRLFPVVCLPRAMMMM